MSTNNYLLLSAKCVRKFHDLKYFELDHISKPLSSRWGHDELEGSNPLGIDTSMLSMGQIAKIRAMRIYNIFTMKHKCVIIRI